MERRKVNSVFFADPPGGYQAYSWSCKRSVQEDSKF